MRSLYVMTVVFVLGSLGLGMLAKDEWEEADRLEARNRGLQVDFDALSAESGSLDRAEPFPLRFKEDALSELFSRAIEAGEVLGAGVRVEPRNASMGVQEMQFVEFKAGVQRCEVTLQAGLEREGAGAILTMLEEELGELPVSVRKTRVRLVGQAVSVSMDVDVFGR